MNAQTTIDLNGDVTHGSLLGYRFMQLAAAEGYWHLRSVRWSTELEELPVGLEVIATARSEISGARELIVETEDALAYIDLSGGKAIARIAGQELIDVEAAARWLREHIPERAPSGRQEAKLEFWCWGRFGPESSDRTLSVPTWTELDGNYAPATAEALGRLLAWRPSDQGGRLLLWHGPPGTGKTHALRALAWEWRSWCDLHYITDPETFFGDRPSYMLELLMTKNEAGARDRWRLLVLEDTGELMRVDAKDRVGQGLSRLLNLVDGLIGQGFPVMVLVTTNEPLAELHDAVSRPGRCAANIDFDPLPVDAARAWLRRHDNAHEPTGVLTLAELYAVLEGEIPAPRPPVGFAR